MDFIWRLLWPLLLAIWVVDGSRHLLVSAGSSSDRDAYVLLANHFTEYGRSNLPRDLIRSAHSLKTSGPQGYRGDLHAKRLGSETLRQLEPLIATLGSVEHPDLLAHNGQVDPDNARVCSGENLARLRYLAEAMRSGYRWQMKHDVGGKFILMRPASLNRAISNLNQETQARCLPALNAKNSDATFLGSLEANYGESLGQLDAIARVELEREYARFGEEQKACEFYDIKAQKALGKTIAQSPSDLDQVALDQLQVALADIHKRRTNGQPLERVNRRTLKPVKLTRDDLVEYLRAYLLDPCRELLVDTNSQQQVPVAAGSLKPATDLLVSDFIVAITRHPMPPASSVPILSGVSGTGDKLQLAWPLRFFMCERIVRTGELELAKRLMQQRS